MLKVVQRFVAVNAVGAHHKYSAKPDLQVLDLLANLSAKNSSSIIKS
jgi:hypothetical protein